MAREVVAAVTSGANVSRLTISGNGSGRSPVEGGCMGVTSAMSTFDSGKDVQHYMTRGDPPYTCCASLQEIRKSQRMSFLVGRLGNGHSRSG